uniref:Crinkler effector protein N-terminal domain-containing protein n=1 Tax=Globisporangium ultimum (strain ATCC 200006 / CBS 805.95 / DAOM BR144) TaxID=431595 RepID=K3WF69_GLOUD
MPLDLTCVLLGAGGASRVVCVEVEARRKVAHLKELLQRRNTDLLRCHDADLELFAGEDLLQSVVDEDLFLYKSSSASSTSTSSYASISGSKLASVVTLEDATKLSAAYPLHTYFPALSDVPGVIHVVVKIKANALIQDTVSRANDENVNVHDNGHDTRAVVQSLALSASMLSSDDDEAGDDRENGEVQHDDSAIQDVSSQSVCPAFTGTTLSTTRYETHNTDGTVRGGGYSIIPLLVTEDDAFVSDGEEEHAPHGLSGDNSEASARHQIQEHVSLLPLIPPQQAFPWVNWDAYGLARLPDTFEFPKGSIQTAWQYWCCGNETEKCPPFRLLSAKHFPMADDQKRWFDFRILCTAIEEKTRERGCWVEYPTDDEAALMYSAVAPELPIASKTPTNRKRRYDLMWTTAARFVRDHRNRLKKLRKVQQRQEADA